MDRSLESNGGTKFELLVNDRGGYAVFAPPSFDDIPEQLPFWLSQLVEKWFQDRPHLRVRTILPVISQGDLVAVYAWYDQVQWPQQPGGKDGPP